MIKTLKQNTIKDKIFNIKFMMFSGLMFILTLMQNGVADAVDVQRKAPKISSNGTVQLEGDAGKLSPESGVNSLLDRGSFWVGVVIAAFGLLVVITAVAKGYKATKEISENNESGWSRVKNVVIGAIVFGIICAMAGIFIAFGTTIGADVFK